MLCADQAVARLLPCDELASLLDPTAAQAHLDEVFERLERL
jgi:hypothetical protein